MYGIGTLTLPQAIFRQEGSVDASGNWITSSLGYRLNNPGNLNFAGQPNCWQSGQGNGMEAQCATLADGIAATERQLALDASRGLTLSQRLATWATGNRDAYLTNVSSWLGVAPDTPLSELVGTSTLPAPGPDTGSPIDFWDSVGVAEGGLSTAAVLGLSVLAAGLLWSTLD